MSPNPFDNYLEGINAADLPGVFIWMSKYPGNTVLMYSIPVSPPLCRPRTLHCSVVACQDVKGQSQRRATVSYPFGLVLNPMPPKMRSRRFGSLPKSLRRQAFRQMVPPNGELSCDIEITNHVTLLSEKDQVTIAPT
jgi:hypothetical protein